MSYFLAKVKVGARLSVDRHVEVWEESDKDKIFLGKKIPSRGNGSEVKLIAHGYGTKTEYVNGAAYAAFRDVELLTPMCLINSPLLDGHRHDHY